MDFYRALAATMDPLARRVDRDAPDGSEEDHALGQIEEDTTGRTAMMDQIK